MKIEASLPKGMRDFLPAELVKRQYIIKTIKTVFELYGFQGIETPVMENIKTLTGKYGDEGDKLLFKVLNSGDYLDKISDEVYKQKDSKELTKEIVEKGLRYDLTVPLARYVVQNQEYITFPFKRYHIAPVWRADRPQKGRYREFYQCDADVIGSKSLYNEVELMQIYSSVFKELNLNVEIKYNNRKILVGFMQAMGLQGKETAAITCIDKLDKIGIEKVLVELSILGLSKENESVFKEIIETNSLVKLPDTELLNKGKEEIAFIESFKIENCAFDISLARGLDYYTGCVFEVVCKDYSIGSLGGGGRYDNLTEMFGKNELTGVGISFGLDRIYDTLEALDKFPETIGARTTLMFACFSETNQEFAFKALATLRQNGIVAEMYPDVVKFPKQMKYANDKNIPFVAIVGDNEMNENKFMLKNMTTGHQELVDIRSLIEAVK